MTLHFDYIHLVAGALLLIGVVWSWVRTWRRKWTAHKAFEFATHSAGAVSAILLGLNLGAVSNDIAASLLILALCFGVVASVMKKWESKTAIRVNRQNELTSSSDGPQFQGYRTTPRI